MASTGIAVPPLPPSLLPLALGQRTVSLIVPEVGTVLGTPDEVRAVAAGLRAAEGAPVQAAENCRQAIAAGAVPFGATRVDGAAAGPMRRHRGGYRLPMTFNVFYARQGGFEARHATINCLLNRAGDVLAYSQPSAPVIVRAGR